MSPNRPHLDPLRPQSQQNPTQPRSEIGAKSPVDALDQLLLSHLGDPTCPLTPSSGFAASVMESIYQQTAVVPEPIPFPWRRTLPFALALLLILAALIFLQATPGSAALAQRPTLSAATTAWLGAFGITISLTIATATVSFRLATRH